MICLYNNKYTHDTKYLAVTTTVIYYSPLTPMGYGGGMVSEPPVCEGGEAELCKGGFLGYPRYELGYRQPHPYVNHGYQHEPTSPAPGKLYWSSFSVFFILSFELDSK